MAVVNQTTFHSKDELISYLRTEDYINLTGRLRERRLIAIAEYVWNHAFTPDGGDTITVETERKKYAWFTLDEMVSEAAHILAI